MDPMTLALIVGLGGQLVGNLFNMWGANKAESEATKYADQMRDLGREALGKTDLNNIAGSMAKTAVGRTGGQLASAGTYGSSLANQTYQSVISDVIGRLAPAQQQGMLQAYQLMMTPDQQLLNLYGNAATGASQSGGMDLSFLSWLPMMSGSGSATGLSGFNTGGMGL